MPNAKPTIREILLKESPSLKRSRQMNLLTKNFTDVLMFFKAMCSVEMIGDWQVLQIKRCIDSVSSDNPGTIFLNSRLAQLTSLSFPFFEIEIEPQYGHEQGDLNVRKNSTTDGIFFWRKPGKVRDKKSDNFKPALNSLFRYIVFTSSLLNIR